MAQRVEFAQPPRLTGNAEFDFPAIVDWVWQLYRALILQKGVVQSSDFEAQMQEKFLTLYNLSATAGGADKLPYFTGANDWALTGLSAFMRTLLDDADEIAARTTLGVTAYTDEQARDAVGAMLTDTGTIDFTYDDGADTVTARTIGLSVTVTTAKLTGGGVNGSMTFVNGLLQSQVQAT
jgi:hypothetical protein